MPNLKVNVIDQNNVNIAVTPQPNQVITIDRGVVGPPGPPGPPGPNNIGGYPVALTGTPQNYDALMFVTGNWTNIPQTEIADGGNF